MTIKFTGRSLIEMGYEPAPWFGDALTEIAANSAPDDAVVREIAERHMSAYIGNMPEVIPPREQPIPFTLNLTVETEAEQKNRDAVVNTPRLVGHT